MTDNEIIKDLNRSILNAKMVGRRVCSLDVYKLKSILDFINRQKEKIKKFDEKLVIQQGLIDYQKAEIDRLKKEVEDKERAYNDEFCLRKEWQSKCRELLKEKQITESEAIKEFADRLKRYELSMYCSFPKTNIGSENYIVLSDSIDNIVKEMTEVNEDDRA